MVKSRVRNILGLDEQTHSSVRTDLDVREKNVLTERQQLLLERLLRKKRSHSYIDLFGCLDDGGNVHNEKQVQELLKALKDEFPPAELSPIEFLLAVLGPCCIGPGYDVHTLTLADEIIDHYLKTQSLYSKLEKGRALLHSGGYQLVEVYTTCCCAVDEQGNVSIVKN